MQVGWSTNIGGLGCCFTHVEIYYWTTPQPICSSDPAVIHPSWTVTVILSLFKFSHHHGTNSSSTSLLTPDENLAGAPLSVGLKVGEEFGPGNAMKCVSSMIILDLYSHFGGQSLELVLDFTLRCQQSLGCNFWGTGIWAVGERKHCRDE